MPSDANLHLSDDQLATLHKTATLETTLFDLARGSLGERSKLTGESTDKDHVYLELNRIMSLNNYKPANLTGKHDISDKDLPKTWNGVHSHEEFKLYTSGSDGKNGPCDPAALREQLRRQIINETSTVPVGLGEGYAQVWGRMHPEKTPDQINAEAHRIKAINGNRDVLKVGERLATATEEERARELDRRFKDAQDQGACPVPNGKSNPKPNPNPNPDTGADHGAGNPPKQGTPTRPPVDNQPVKPPVDDPSKKQPSGPGQHPGGPSDKTPAQPGAGKTPPGGANTPKPPVDAGPDLQGAYLALVRQHNISVRNLREDENGQGIIGKAFDAAKNSIGSSGEGHAWYDPRRIWSGVLDSDMGSKAVNQKMDAEKAKLDQLKQAADAKDVGHFSSIYKDITGKDFDVTGKSSSSPGAAALAQAYDRSQHNGVDGITDIGVAVAVASTLRSGKLGMTETLLKGMATGAVVGGVSKAGLMQIDGHYANLKHDLSVGALMGATVPIGELGGAQLSRIVGKRMGLTVTGDLLGARIETQGAAIGTRVLSAATKSGVSGGIFGALESPGRVAINDVEAGRPISAHELATASLKGSVMGFLGGTALGFTADSVVNGFRSLRPGEVTSFKPKVNGVDAPASGGVDMDTAAKMLKMEPDALAREAADKPYAAVQKAVKLYEDTGLNIKKTDALTGDGVLPKPFEEALSTVQNVDLLTADAAMKLGGKVKVVEATDTFLKGNPAAVDEPMARVAADPNYQEVVKLKTAEGGKPAADAFEQKFRQGFEKDLKTNMAVEQVKAKGLQPEEALKKSQPEVEAAYKQKAADYFKDMTDPAQRERLNTLVEDIYQKFNPESLSKSDIESMLAAVPQSDRQLAAALLHESAGTSSDVLIRARMQELKGQISSHVGDYGPNDVYTLAPDSSANLLGYLYRKSNSISMDMHNIDALASKVQSGDTPHSVVLFDDLSSTPISQANMAMLKKIPNVYVVDVGAFEKAVNIIDVSKGPQAVATKLDALLTQAREIKAANPGMLDTGVAKLTLSAGVDEAAKAIGPNAHVIRPTGKYQIPDAPATSSVAKASNTSAVQDVAPANTVPSGAAQGDAVPSGAAHGDAVQSGAAQGNVVQSGAAHGDAVQSGVGRMDAGPTDAVQEGSVHADAVPSDAIKDSGVNPDDVNSIYAAYNIPKASRDQIAGFLSGYVGEERELAARMLAEGAVHNSFPVMVQKAIALHSNLTDALAKGGISTKDLLIVSDKDPGGSTHLVSYLFGKVNGLSPENFISNQRLNQIIQSGAARDKAVAYFDDTIYSGSQTAGMLNNNVSSLMPFKKVVIASLGAYDKGVSRINGTHLGSLGKVEVATSSMHQPFYSSKNPFFSQLTSSQQYAVKGIGGSEGFGDVQGSLIWSYMYPDNNLNFFGPKFSGKVLHLPGP